MKLTRAEIEKQLKEHQGVRIGWSLITKEKSSYFVVDLSRKEHAFKTEKAAIDFFCSIHNNI